MTTLEAIKAILRDDMVDDAEAYSLYCVIRDALARYDGKKITKHLATAAEKAIHAAFGEDWMVQYTMPYGMYYLNVWKFGTKHDITNPRTFLLGHQTNGTFYLGDEKDWRNSHGFAYHGVAARERNEKRQRLLEDDGILQEYADAIDAYRAAKARMKEVEASLDSIENPSYYRVRKELIEREVQGD